MFFFVKKLKYPAILVELLNCQGYLVFETIEIWKLTRQFHQRPLNPPLQSGTLYHAPSFEGGGIFQFPNF